MTPKVAKMGQKGPKVAKCARRCPSKRAISALESQKVLRPVKSGQKVLKSEKWPSVQTRVRTIGQLTRFWPFCDLFCLILHIRDRFLQCSVPSAAPGADF